MTAWSVCPGAHLSSTGLASLVALDRVKGRPSTGLPTHEEQEQGVWSASPEAWLLLVRWGASPGCLTHLGVGRQLQAELELFTGAQQALTRRDCHCAHVCLRPQELQDTGWAYCLVRLPDGAGSTQSSNPESWTGLGASRKTKTTTITTTQRLLSSPGRGGLHRPP